MKRIKALQLTQFFLYESAQYDLKDMTGITAPTGTGKSSTVDAAILLLSGANKNFMPFNAQTDDRSRRTVKDYCLGVVHEKSTDGSSLADQARHEALSYVAILIHDETDDVWTTAGVCIAARDEDSKDEIKGRFVARGVKLELGDYLIGVGDDKRPRQWDDFAEDLRRRSKAAGYDAEFASGAENFTQSLLYQIVGPGVDHRRFLRTMNTALKLNKIPSVDGFVRDFLVESKHIDKEQALTQIRELRSLLELIATVEKKIGQLGAIENRGERLLAVESTGKALQLLLIELDQDESMEKQVSVEDNIEHLEGELKAARSRQTKLGTTHETVQGEIDRLERSLSRDENRQQRKHYSDLINSKSEVLTSQSNMLHTQLGETRRALVAASQSPALKDQAKTLSVAAQGLVDATNSSITSGEPELLLSAFDHATAALESVDKHIDRALRELDRQVSALREDVTSLKGRISAGGVQVSPHVSVAMGLLHSKGINARPAFDGVKVTAPEWQGAIEAFLNRNLEGLIVPEGREDDAVTLLMNHPDGHGARKAKIVQPHHFRENGTPASDTVASLITHAAPEGRVAARYLQAVLGNMVRVQDVEGLRKHSRSMMPNGAYSASFGTHPYPQALPEREWKLGETPQRDDTARLQLELNSKLEQLSSAQTSLEMMRTASKLASTVADKDVAKTELTTTLAVITETRAEITRLEALMLAVNVSATEELEAQLTTAKDRRKSIQQQLQEVAAAIGSKETSIESQANFLADESKKYSDLARQYTDLRERLNVDDQVVEQVKQKIDPDDDKAIEAKREMAVELRDRSIRRVDSEGKLIQADFTKFCTDFDQMLIEERHDWHLAYQYAKRVGQELRETTLVTKRRQVEEARLAAEEAFRSHVAVTIYAEIQQMKKGINDLNAILRNCNEFTNGERYKFIWSYRSEFKPIYNYIERAAKSEGPLFMEQGQEDVIELLEGLSDTHGDLDENPLEDYLLMFEFDVEIQVNGQRRGLLSKRLGKGSGGEHKAPLYVIVAAALHHAYRLGSNPGAAGVMLIDEAFEKLDVNNALAVSDFIRELGLQVIAAAPDDKHNLMTMCMDRVYTLIRYDQVRLDMEYADYKRGTRELLSSDDPQLNTALLDEMALKYAV